MIFAKKLTKFRILHDFCPKNIFPNLGGGGNCLPCSNLLRLCVMEMIVSTKVPEMVTTVNSTDIVAMVQCLGFRRGSTDGVGISVNLGSCSTVVCSLDILQFLCYNNIGKE